MVQVGPTCSTKVQAVSCNFRGTCQRVPSREFRAGSSAWKAVSLSVQNLRRTIPNVYFTHQNLLSKDRVPRLMRRRSVENCRGNNLAGEPPIQWPRSEER